jgi:hypothetical protein
MLIIPNIDVSKGIEKTVAPTGKYTLLIKSVKMHTNKDTGANSVLVGFTFPQDIEYASFTQYFTIPNSSHKENAADFMILNLKRLVWHFLGEELEPDFDFETLIGTSAETPVVQDCNKNFRDGAPTQKVNLPPLPTNA